MTAQSAAEGRELAAQIRPDLLLSDIGMPQEDGYSLIRSIRALPLDEGGALPAIAVTALARPEDHQRALSAGFQSHLAKPLQARDLLSAVARLTGRALA